MDIVVFYMVGSRVFNSLLLLSSKCNIATQKKNCMNYRLNWENPNQVVTYELEYMMGF